MDAAVTLHRADVLRSAPAGALAVGQALDRPVPSLPLLDERGRGTSLEAFRGRSVVMAPFLTLCHETCPLTTGALMRLEAAVRRRGLERRVAVVAASVDPWRDSPARLRAFKRRTGSNLRMLTGTPAQLRRLWRFFGVEYHRVREGDPPDRDWWTHRAQTLDVTHTEGLFILDPRGHWRVLVPGIADLGGRLAPALRSLLDQEGRASLRTPTGAWTVPAVLGDLWRVMGIPPEPSGADSASPATGPPPPGLAAAPADAGRLLGGGRSSLPPPARRPARTPGRRQRVGVVVSALPLRAPAVRGGRPALRRPGRVPRARRVRRRRPRARVPRRPSRRLSQLQRRRRRRRPFARGSAGPARHAVPGREGEGIPRPRRCLPEPNGAGRRCRGCPGPRVLKRA